MGGGWGRQCDGICQRFLASDSGGQRDGWDMVDIHRRCHNNSQSYPTPFFIFFFIICITMKIDTEVFFFTCLFFSTRSINILFFKMFYGYGVGKILLKAMSNMSQISLTNQSLCVRCQPC